MELNWKSCLRAGVTLAALWLLTHYWPQLSGMAGLVLGAALPLLLGCVIAYILNIPMSFFEQKLFARSRRPAAQRLRRPVCILLAVVSILLLAVFVAYMIVPELARCVQLLLDELPKALETGFRWLEENFQISELFQSGNNPFQNSELDWRELLTKGFQLVFSGVSDAVGMAVGVVATVFSGLVTVAVALIFSLYLLAGKERIAGQLRALMDRYLPEKVVCSSLSILRTLNQSFHSFIVGQCIEAVILGALCMAGMFLLGLPYAAMIGCLVGFTALIPVAGAYIGAVVGAFMIFTISPVKAVIFVVFLVILQQLEGNLIYPRVVGSSIGLPGIWVLTAVTVGGGVLGIGGMLLGVPLAAAVYQLLRAEVRRGRSAQAVSESDSSQE